MIYVKFDENNKSTEMRIDLPADGEVSDYFEVSDNALFGKRLIKAGAEIREFTESEYDAEALLIDTANKALVIDNMARIKLQHSLEEISSDVYDGLSDNQKEKVRTYRAALRNINKQERYPEFVEFPDELIVEEL
jgi:hypothetical protein